MARKLENQRLVDMTFSDFACVESLSSNTAFSDEAIQASNQDESSIRIEQSGASAPTAPRPTNKIPRSVLLAGANIIAIVALMFAPGEISVGPLVISIGGLLLLAGVLSIVPAAVAALRGCTQAGSIALLNVILGWTIVGWGAALVWALRAPAAEDSGESSLKAGCAISIISLALAVVSCSSPNCLLPRILSFLLLSIVLPAHWGVTNYRIHQVLRKKSSAHGVAGWEAFVASGITSCVLLVAGTALANVALFLPVLFSMAKSLAASRDGFAAVYLSGYLVLSVAVLWGSVMLYAIGQARVNYVLSNAIVSDKPRSLIAKLLPAAGFFAATVYAPFAIDGDNAFFSLSYISVWTAVAFFCGYFFTIPLLRHRQTQKELD